MMSFSGIRPKRDVGNYAITFELMVSFYPYVKEMRLGIILCKISHIQHDKMRQMSILTFSDVI